MSRHPGTRRLFFALWPPAGLADVLHQQAQGLQAVWGGRAMRADTLHLTLAFLGDVPEERLSAVIEAGDQTTGPGFEIHIDRLGHWPRQHVVWAGCHNMPPALAELAEDLAERLRGASFPIERRTFAPHVTLLRNGAGDVLPTIDPLYWRVGAFRLVESTPTAAGASYRALKEWPLGEWPPGYAIG